MADYFTRFSLVMNLPTEAAQTYALEIHHQASQANLGDDLPKDFPQALVAVTEDWQFGSVAPISDVKTVCSRSVRSVLTGQNSVFRV